MASVLRNGEDEAGYVTNAPCGTYKIGHFLQEWLHFTAKIPAREGADSLLPSDLPSIELAGIQRAERSANGNLLIDQALGELLPLGDD